MNSFFLSRWGIMKLQIQSRRRFIRWSDLWKPRKTDVLLHSSELFGVTRRRSTVRHRKATNGSVQDHVEAAPRRKFIGSF